jgi:hypothetical protein
VLPNGDAEVVVTFDSLKMTASGSPIPLDTTTFPAVTMTMSPSGQVKSSQGIDKMSSAFGGMPFMDMGSLAQNSAFPARLLNIGDSWTQDVPFPMGGKLLVRAKLTGSDGRTAKIKQAITGKVNINSPMTAAVTGATMNSKGDVSMDCPGRSPESVMERLPVGMLPVGLLAVGAVIYSLVPGGRSSGPAPRAQLAPEAGKEAAGAGGAAAKRHPLTPLYEYLDMLTGQAKASLAQEVTGKKTCADEDRHPVRFLLATVPDPIDSHVAQSFDRAVDAIQSAMQDSGISSTASVFFER